MKTLSSMKTLVSRLRARPIISLVGIVALVLAAGLGITAWVLDDSVDSFDTAEVVNQAGGYRLEVPKDWAVRHQGRTTTLSSPTKDAVITVGPGNPGPLYKAGALFFQQVRNQYRDVQLTGVDGQRVGPMPALHYAGTGANSKNVRVRFLAITIEHKPANYAISVFAAASSDPETVLPRANTVVGTFRPLDQQP